MGRKWGGTNYYGKYAGMAVVLFFVAGAASTAQAQVTSTIEINGSTAHAVEWDLAVLPDQLDVNPGAITVDTRGEDHNQLWFVTRFGAQRIYRFNPPESLLKGDAQFTSWGLRPDPNFAGGIKRVRPSHDRRFIYARTPVTVQRIDSQNCTTDKTTLASSCSRVVWTMPGDDELLVSDVAADDMNKIFTTGVSSDARFQTGYVQMLDPNSTLTTTVDAAGVATTTTTVKRWADDFGAGQCTSQNATVCNAGIDVGPNKQNLIYFVENLGQGFIAELNVANLKPSSTSPNLRRWSLAKLAGLTGDPTIAQPRMLKIDRSGKIWVNTGSGHLISLDPNTNRMTKHQIPGLGTNDSSTNDPWGVAPDDDVIGYTAANLNKVAMMFPKRAPVTVPPDPGFLPIFDFPVVVSKETADVAKINVPGIPKVVPTKTTRNDDGLFIEGIVSSETTADGSASTPSLQPLGITANRAKAQGSFFYTVGLSVAANDPTTPVGAKRIGFIRLPMKDRAKFARDDDDPDDGFDRNRDSRWHNAEPGDDDADGVPNDYDTNTTRDNMTVSDPAVVAVGQSWDYPMSTSPTTLALIAAVTPDVATATIAVDVYNSIGTLVGTSGPIVGAAVATVPAPTAGNYTIRVRNLGTTTVSPTSTTVVREPGIQQ